MTSWLTALDLRDVTAVVQDWGSLIGLRVAAENGDRFAKLFIANGFPPPRSSRCRPPSESGAPSPRRHSPWFNAGRLVDLGTVKKLSAAVRAGYDAPFPDRRYQAGARIFPQLVPTSPSDPAVPANRAAWEVLRNWHKPVLCVFGTRDPILGKADAPSSGIFREPRANLTPGSRPVISFRRTPGRNWPADWWNGTPGWRRDRFQSGSQERNTTVRPESALDKDDFVGLAKAVDP